MKILELLDRDGALELYRVELSEQEQARRADGRTYRSLRKIASVRRRRGVVAAVLVTLLLVIAADFSYIIFPCRLDRFHGSK